MRNVRRYYVPNAEYFITIVTHDRKPLFARESSVHLLEESFRQTAQRIRFTMRAFVILPNHIHALIKPLDRLDDISRVVGITKRNFTRSYRLRPGSSQDSKIWQERFWDHIIRNETDLKIHVDYIHFNPVKHGLVKAPEEHPYSSFLGFVENGEYELGWGHEEPRNLQKMNRVIEPAFFN